MSNQPRPPLNAFKSARTNKPLVVECDYNTKRHNLTFDSARNCSCDVLKAKVKESFKLTTRPFNIRWDDDDGEQNYILDEGALDEAIQYYESSDGSSVTIFVKISLEYDGPSHSDVIPLVGREADLAEGYQDPLIHAEFSSLQVGNATSTSSKAGSSVDAGRSMPNSLPWKPPSHLSVANSESCASSVDDDASGKGVLNGSTGGRGSHSADRGSNGPPVFELLKRQERRNPSLSRGHTLFQTPLGQTWMPKPPHAFPPSISLGDSFSLNTDSPMSDAGLPDPPESRERRDDYASFRSSWPAGDSDYEVPVNGSQPITCCSECDGLLDCIKYICTTCGEKTPMSRAAAATAARSREASTSPTILGRSLGSPASPSSSARVGYELCAPCFERVGIDHSWSSCVSGSFSTEEELKKARRSPPKQKGLLRHAFMEQIWDSHSWRDLEQEDMLRQCSACNGDLPADRYKCASGDCNNYTICRGCFSIVHEVHPRHPFLDMKAKPPSYHLETSDSGITVANGNVDESLPIYKCSYCRQVIVGYRMHCTTCNGIELCSNCDEAGVSSSPDSGHSSFHTMERIWLYNGTQDVSQRHGLDSAELRPTPGSTEENFIHTQSCDSCTETIVGARYQCLNCPSRPTAYNLCSDCEVKSYIVHDPMHTFLKLPRVVDIPSSLESESPFLPVLYRSPAGPAPGSSSSNMSNHSDPAAYLRSLTHTDVICDKHCGKIVGKWHRCAFSGCARDLCADCEAFDTHDRTHAFLVLKARVDNLAFRPLHELGKAGSPQLLGGNIYNPRR
ncbi:hypothetical protein EI94DRAFT_1788897 [Lactarius quietus]|nr:hypothetical protein EI94DRAFT_1788897 [Lactarius quietus]